MKTNSPPGGVVGRGPPGVAREGVADSEGLDRERTIPVGVTVGVEEVVGGRLEDEMGVEVESYAGTIEDESGVDSTDLVALPSQTN